MPQYFINGKYMTEYKQVFIGYPNQMFSLFWYWGYLLAHKYIWLSFFLFYPLFLFGIYSCYKIFLYFSKKEILSFFYILVLVSIGWIVESANNPDIYLSYLFFFSSSIYLSLYHSKKVYLIAIWIAIGSLFRNQLATFIPFIPFIINPNLTKKEYFINIIKISLIVLFTQISFEQIKNIIGIIDPSNSNGNSWYIKEFTNGSLFLIFSLKAIKQIILENFNNYFFYLVIAPCFFIFNKKFMITTPKNTKNLLKIFLIISLFIYIMPALMYPLKSPPYHDLIRRYTINMFVLLIPIYHFIINTILSENKLFYLKNNQFIMIFIFLLFLPILSFKDSFICINNTIKNFTSFKRTELLGVNSKEIKNIIKNNFSSNATFSFSHRYFMLYFPPEQKYTLFRYIKPNQSFDGIMFLNSKKPDVLEINKLSYKKIYKNNRVSIYKKVN